MRRRDFIAAFGIAAAFRVSATTGASAFWFPQQPMSQVPLPRFAKVWQVWDTKRGKNVAADEVID